MRWQAEELAEIPRQEAASRLLHADAEDDLRRADEDEHGDAADRRAIAPLRLHAARTLVEDGHEGEAYVLTGPEALSYADMAAKLSDAAGREVTYVPISPEQFRQGALAAGLPEWLVSALERLNEIFAAGYAAEVTDHVRAVGKKEPTTFDQFARDQAQAFKG